MIFDKLKDLKVGSVIVKTPIADIGLIQDAPEREISKCYIHAIKGSILTNETGVSAIVCPTNRYFKPGNGSLDEKIFEKAGSGLRRELKQLGTCEEGCAEVSGAYDLPYKYIIHVVGKVWSGNNQENERSLAVLDKSNCLLNDLLDCP